MIKLDVKIDTKNIERQLADSQKQIKFATARALTRTAQQASADMRTAIEKAFRSPTEFTKRAFYAKPARTTDLTSWVGAREFAPKGRPASKYLAPEIEGGTRGMKAFERALSAISGGQYVMPGRGATLDANGNMSRGQIVQVLSRLGVLADPFQNLSAKTTKRLGKKGLLTVASGMRSEYFVAKSKADGRPLGIYKLQGRGIVVPIMIFTTKRPTYSIRLPFGEIVNNSIAKNWERITDEEIKNALATARLT